MSAEKTPSEKSNHDSDPIGFIFQTPLKNEKISFTTNFENNRIKNVPFFVGYYAVALAVGVNLGSHIGSFLGDNKERFGPIIESATSFTSLNNEMSIFASEIANMQIRVDCNDDVLDKNTFDEDGQTWIVQGQVVPIITAENEHYLPPVTTLRESICETITDFDPKENTLPFLNFADYESVIAETNYSDSVYVVLHEIEHMKQVFDEAEATCYAGQKLEETLIDLGFSEDDAYAAAATTAYDQQKNSPNRYLSEECRPGGELDLGISDIYITKK